MDSSKSVKFSTVRTAAISDPSMVAGSVFDPSRANPTRTAPETADSEKADHRSRLPSGGGHEVTQVPGSDRLR
jgi:hypothetical protein